MGLPFSAHYVESAIDIDNLDNPKIAAKVREVALAIPGVISAEPSAAVGKVVVRFQPAKTNVSLIWRTLMAAGFTSRRAELAHYNNLRNYVSQNPKAHTAARKAL